MTSCPYSLDGLACEQEFAHLGRHEATVKMRTGDQKVTWEYEEDQRLDDRGLGWEGVIERNVAEEMAANTEVVEEAEHTVPPEPPNPAVAEARRARVDEPIVKVAVGLRSGKTDRHDAISISLDEFGNLHVSTRSADILYAHGTWASSTKEPT
jgi:hypothetical protein